MITSPAIDYQTLFRALPGAYLLLAADGTVLDNSDQHVVASMLPRHQAAGRSIFEAYPSAPESQRALQASQDAVRRTRQPDTMPLLRYDLARPAEQGGGTEERYWQLTHYPLLDAQGEVQYILQISQDVTEQLRTSRAAAAAQQQLAQEQTRSRFLLDSLPVLVWTATPDGRRDYFNPRWLAFTGCDEASQLGEGWLESLHPADRDRVRAQWRQAAAAGTPYQVEYRLRRPDGQYRWVLSRAMPQHDEAAAVVRWVGGVTDIHDQKQLVEEVLAANEQQAILSDQAYQNFKQVQQQRQVFYSLLLHAPAHICIVRGPEHRYEFANEEFLALTQGQPVLGRPVAEVYPETVGQGLVAILDQVLQTGQPYRGHERPLYLRDGTGQLQERFYNFVYDCFEEDGQPAGVTGYAQDVTELVRTRQQCQRPAAPPAG